MQCTRAGEKQMEPAKTNSEFRIAIQRIKMHQNCESSENRKFQKIQIAPNAQFNAVDLRLMGKNFKIRVFFDEIQDKCYLSYFKLNHCKYTCS